MAEQPLILALAGGVGGGKFCRGLVDVLPPEQLTIAVNTADDFEHLGLHISPDIDSVLYALADLNDLERGWGLAGETWNFMDAMERLGGETWFRLGDRDLATHVLRTKEMNAGRTLSEVTATLTQRLGIKHPVVPMSDAPVRTVVETDEGPLDFQDYFVRRQCKPVFRGVTLRGSTAASPSEGLRHALNTANVIIVTPSNPFVSVDPILALPGVAEALSRLPVIAVSPIVGGRAVKGPLAKMMNEIDVDPSALGIAQHYGHLVDGWIIDTLDRDLAPAIESLGCRVKVCDTIMRTLDDKRRLAQDAMMLVSELAATPV